MVQITGTLNKPTGGVYANTEIRITALNTEDVLTGAYASVKTGSDGVYDFNLVNGELRIEVLFDGDEYSLAGSVLIDGTVTGPLSLQALLVNHAVPEVVS